MRLRVLSASAALALGALVTLPATSAGANSGPPTPTSTNGHPVELVASGMHTPTSFAFADDGTVFEGDGGSESKGPPDGGIYAINNGTATKLDTPLLFVAGLAWRNGSLYASGGVLKGSAPSWVLMRFDGWNGTAFTSSSILYRAPKKFDGFNGLAFGNDGRLYVGADVGLTDNNDHGPRSTSPHVYQILSFTSAGKDLKVFAKGIRQPWQMVFPTGSNSPYVTALGQDKGAKNPPDYLLRVKAGQDYGFPMCNQLQAKPCHGYAKPFEQFAAHTDLMGIGMAGKTLYLTSFLGDKGQAGEVFSLPASGGKLTPLIRGFVAPTVGLAVNGGYVYVGELNGDVYRVQL
jgi:glucose/arabinose dehydrogenase